MQKFVDIRGLVMHMAVELDRLMEGTQHKGPAMYKHDALALMTTKEKKE